VTADFGDTSALAKLYLGERGSEWSVERAGSNAVAISELAHVEVASFLARRYAEGEFDVSVQHQVYGRYLEDTRRFEVVRLSASLTAAAASLMLSGVLGFRVRSLDAIQLASALWWFEQTRALNIESGAFIVADGPLRDAAVVVGLVVDNPEEHE
jgi:predicted nucleic acid-binding protein